ncbi:Uncharacterised protein [BD1-7 clade bacterium]|uniref:N-acetyltransferase domain-containing protein n=1 Tax=BD1-7 clade bacterium TaxID=2029982 RepID=A0A5S9NMC7_9GAMM|nr:Uncharacterised protein [BD1-7 clade bacterium]CAA0094174.1 Uncharacterised protein [BD1-7 clade bacterium]
MECQIQKKLQIGPATCTEDLRLIKRFYRHQHEKVAFRDNDSIYRMTLSTSQCGGVELVTVGAMKLTGVSSQHKLHDQKSDQLHSSSAARRLNDEPDLWVRNLLVAEAYRRQGLAATLLLNVIDRRPGARYWAFAEPYLAGFYTQAGFVEKQSSSLPQSLSDKWQRYRRSGGESDQIWLLSSHEK